MTLNKKEEKSFLRLKLECDVFLENKDLNYTNRNVIFFLTIKIAKLENKIKELENGKNNDNDNQSKYITDIGRA